MEDWFSGGWDLGHNSARVNSWSMCWAPDARKKHNILFCIFQKWLGTLFAQPSINSRFCCLNHHLLAQGFLYDQRGITGTASRSLFLWNYLKWPKLALTTALLVRFYKQLLLVGPLLRLATPMAPAPSWPMSELISTDVVDTPVVIISFQERSQHLLIHVSPKLHK